MTASPNAFLHASETFGDLLRQLRRRAGLTQGELAALVGFSLSQISLLERNARLPDPVLVAERFAPALLLADTPHLAQRLVELAALARGERPPAGIQVQRTVQTSLVEEPLESGASLPAPLTPLLGREAAVADGARRLSESPGRLLTLLGPPGVGKTRLALAIAARLQPLLVGGCYLVTLAQDSSPADLATAILLALGRSDTVGQAPQARLVEYLRRKELLLILDDFDHLLAPAGGEAGQGARYLVELLGACPRLYLLVTSRAPLRVRAEQRLKVPPLEPAAAVELFLRRAQAVEPDFAPDPPDLAAITQLCLRLDCLPLAIELLAARVDLLTPQAMLARLQDRRLDLLGDGPHDLPPHQRTLRHAIQRSYTLLSPDEQALFRHLGSFVGGFDLEAIEQTAPAQAAWLASLLAKSLVKPIAGDDGGKRFVLLETLRDFALEELEASGEVTASRTRHATWYLAVAQRAANEIGGRMRSTWLRRLDLEQENLRLALRWLVRHDGAAAQQMVAALREFWYIRGYYSEGRAWAQEVLSAADASTLLRAGVLLALGQLASNQGDGQAAQASLREALAIYRAQDVAAGTARTLIELGWAVYLTYQQQASAALFEEALAIAQRLGDRTLTAHALTSLTHVLVFEGAYTVQLRMYIEESVLLCRQGEDAHALAQALLNLSTFHTQVGDYGAAMRVLGEAEEVVAANDLRPDRAWIDATWAELTMLTHGDLCGVRERLQRANAFFAEAGYDDGMLIVRHHLGELARREGCWEEAQHEFKASHTRAVTAGDARMQARTLFGLGRVALATGQQEEAARLLAEAEQLLATLPAFLPPRIAEEYRQAIEEGCGGTIQVDRR